MNLTPPEPQVLCVDEEAILEACGRYNDLHAWPSNKIEPYGWLENFSEHERPFALHLLSRFIFFADHLVDHLFMSAFQSISNKVSDDSDSFNSRLSDWEQFCSKAVITFVEGDRPGPTDSGFFFARKVRQVLGFSENALLTPAEAVQALREGFSRPVIFVDDFLGSGDQFMGTWTRSYETKCGSLSFYELEMNGFGSNYFYCTAMSTAYGLDRLHRELRAVEYATANIIPESFSLVSSASSMWPRDHLLAGIDMIRQASERIGCNEDGGARDWRGYHQLGLGLAFAHSTPDATLPLFHSEANGWKPLVRRS